MKPAGDAIKPGDLIRFLPQPNREPTLALVLAVTSSVYQLDEIEDEVRYLHQNGLVLDRAYHLFNGRKYIGMWEFEVIT